MIGATYTFGALITEICVVILNHSAACQNHKAGVSYCMFNVPFLFVDFTMLAILLRPRGSWCASQNTIYESRTRTGLSTICMKHMDILKAE